MPPNIASDEQAFEAIKSGIDALPVGTKMFLNSGKSYPGLHIMWNDPMNIQGSFMVSTRGKPISSCLRASSKNILRMPTELSFQ